MRQLRDFVSCARKGARKAAHENRWPTKTHNATVLHSENRCTTVYQLPSDCVIGWDTKMTSLPNSNASFTNNRDRQIWRDRQNWRLHPTVWAFTAWTEDRVLAWFCWYQTSIIIHRSFTGPSSSFISQCPRTGKFRGVWAGRKSWQNRHRLLQILTCNQYMMTCSKSRYHTGNLQKIKKQLDVHLSFRFAGRCALDSFQQVPVVNQVNVWGWNFPNACGFKTYHSCRISYFSLEVKCTAVCMCMMLEN